MADAPVIQLKTIWLPQSETFVAAWIRSLTRWPALVCAEQFANLDVFPLAACHQLRRPSLIRRGLAALARQRVGDQTIRAPFVADPTLLAALRRAPLLHAHHGEAGPAAWHLAQRTGCPLITSFHGRDVAMAIRHQTAWRYRALFAGGAAFTAVSQRMVRQLIALGAPAERVHYIPTGVVLPAAPAPRAVSAAAPHLIAIGRLTAKKGFAVALEALRMLQAPLPGTRLTLIGDGPQRAALHAQVRRDGLAPYVEFCGALPHHATLAALARADLLIAPSQTASDGDAEGAPVVLMEALAHEVPVVATNHAAIPEVVPDGIAGRLVAEGDAAALAAAVIDLWRQPALRRALGRAGRAHVARQFDLTHAVAQLDALYRQVARC